MLNMIVEVVEDCVNKKQKTKLHEVARAMGEQFRETMLADVGNPRLKQAVLGLLTKLRFENQILNKNKDGPSNYLAAMIGGKLETTPLAAEQDDTEVQFNNLLNTGKGSFRQKRDGSFAMKESADSTIHLQSKRTMQLGGFAAIKQASGQ